MFFIFCLGMVLSSCVRLGCAMVRLVRLCVGVCVAAAARGFYRPARGHVFQVLFLVLSLAAVVRASPTQLPEGCAFFSITPDAGRLCCPSFSASVERGENVRTWPFVTEACGARFPHLLASSTPGVVLVVAPVFWTYWQVAFMICGLLVSVSSSLVALRCIILCRRRSLLARADVLPGYVRARSTSTLLAGSLAPGASSCKLSVCPTEPDVEEELGYLAVRFDALDRRIRGSSSARFVSLLSPPAQDRGRQTEPQECARGNCGGGVADTHFSRDVDTLSTAASTLCNSYALPRR